ncbi:MAG: hydrophobe/amphiphile efflux family protein [Polyangiaceae bacterium]|jgi:multidrug efflux pump|nr:hydrophobe/amphiphile efflux family protein [Polyangiaceae bacterium]
MISRIFIDRPIFAWVISIAIMLAGVGSILLLPIEQYPDIAPPTVNIRATYPGASADTLETSVTQVLEQQLTGLVGLLYFASSSSSQGSASITATFAKGTDPDIAQVQVQNKIQQALSRLPQIVQQLGVTVTKSNPDFLLIIAVYDSTDRSTSGDVSDFLVSTMQEAIGRVPGVGDLRVFGSQYAMRVWLDPARLAANGLMPSDVRAAILTQNTQVAAGQLGAQPGPREQMLNATVIAKARLQTPDQFRNIILKTAPTGAQVLLGDVARVEMGSEDYSTLTRVNGHPGSGMAIMLAPGADALETAETVKAEVVRRSPGFPSGYEYAFPRDSTAFIRLSIEEVVKTLLEAIVLVVVVMFVFLQNWRATLIPAIAVPVVLLGTFGVLQAFGFSINTLTLFGLVLAIGLLVDDAIVVVENVERVMAEQPGISAREATIVSMGEIQTALIAIALVLSAVFLPMAFFGGSTGVIYRQFSVTIVAAMVLSVVVALVLTPALTAGLLKPRRPADAPEPGKRRWLGRLSSGFERAFERITDGYVRGVKRVLAHQGWFLLGYLALSALLAFLFLRLPTGFLPTEDDGTAMVQYTLPAGATQGRASKVGDAVEAYFLGPEKHNVAALFSISGFGFSGSGQNTGMGFLSLTPWDERPGAGRSSAAIARRATSQLSGERDAQIIALTPPPVRGLGQSSGFTLELLNSSALPRDTFLARRNQLLGEAIADPRLAAVRPSELPDAPSLRVTIDEAKVGALGISQDDVYATLSFAWGSTYVNDFVDRGRVKRVYLQGDAPYRSEPADLGSWFVRSRSGSMAPLSAFAQTSWENSPALRARFNGLPSFELQGQAPPGQSSGEAMARIAELAGKLEGTSIAWSGLSYQERLSGGQAPLLYGLSLLVVFLCLAALYESWSVPLSVLLVIPLGVLGAVLGVMLRGLQNDVFFQVGLLTTMGLTAKNAILIVEFAEHAERQGKSATDAALEAARLRLRPILMTSFAFMFGVFPLAISSGAGAMSRIAIGTTVLGGIVAATVLAIYFVPLFFVALRRVFRAKAPA